MFGTFSLNIFNTTIMSFWTFILLVECMVHNIIIRFHFHSTDICQIRLDFFSAVLQQPVATTGLCTSTILTTTQGSTGVTFYNTPPLLCGTLTGQHGKYCRNFLKPLQGSITLDLILPLCNVSLQHIILSVYVEAGTANTAATLKFTLASALDNTWRVHIYNICIDHILLR